MPRYPLGSFGLGASRGPIVTDCHWVRLAPRHWLRLGNTLRTQLASFGDGPCRRHIDTFRNSTHPNWYWLRLGKRPHRPNWLALKIGGHTTAIMQSGPRPFS